MNETPPPPETPAPPQETPAPTPAERAAAARQRFVALNIFRFSGVFLVAIGFLIMMQRFGFVQGMEAKIMGAIIAFVGLFQTLVVPRLLLRAWRTPPQG